MNTPFEEFKAILNSMTPEHRDKLLAAHKEFTRLKSYCEAKGEIEILPQLKGIKVLKLTRQVKELKKVIDILKPGGFIWEDLKTTEKSSKKSSAGS